MNPQRLEAAQALQQLTRFDAIIDARSPAEYALDHLPGAVNWPTLDDAQRQQVGTQYKQVSAFDARKQGAAMAARNIAAHVERETAGLPPTWKPLVYCWRGGQRSGSLALVLAQIGWRVTVLDGGYREFRRQVLQALDEQPGRLQLRVLCGRTGSGKSRLLAALQAHGAQVLDLEALACHRGSVLGALPQGQPTQKAFETALWWALSQLDAARPVFIESESRTIGRLRVPEALLRHMRAAPCVQVQMPATARVQLLMEDYPHFVGDARSLCERLDSLIPVQGHAVVQAWQALAHAGRWHELVQSLLEQHYDPIYERSMARNYAHYGQAPVWHLPDGGAAALDSAARAGVHDCPADPGAAGAQTGGQERKTPLLD
jgi:tRNA 2-selenouridine synthase